MYGVKTAMVLRLKQWGHWENYIMSSVIKSILHIILLGWLNEGG